MNLKTQLQEIAVNDYMIPEGVFRDILISEMMHQNKKSDVIFTSIMS